MRIVLKLVILKNRNHFIINELRFFQVEKMGVEPTTSCMPCKRSSQLSYIPII